MKAVHIICRRNNGIAKGVHPEPGNRELMVSRAWCFEIEDAMALKGGWLFLHETKANGSYLGGIVQEVRRTRLEVARRTDRVEFVFSPKVEGEGRDWRGANYGRAWTSGIIDVEAP